MRPDRGRPRARLDDVYRTTPPKTSIRGTQEQNVKSAVDSGTAKHDTFLLVSSEMRYDRGVARALRKFQFIIDQVPFNNAKVAY
jgi:hypothetical protein